MTIEIRQLIIRAVVQAQPAPAPPQQERDSAGPQTSWSTAPLPSPGGSQESELVARCTRSVLRQLAQLKER
jgi:hypothetical protein